MINGWKKNIKVVCPVVFCGGDGGSVGGGGTYGGGVGPGGGGVGGGSVGPGPKGGRFTVINIGGNGAGGGTLTVKLLKIS